MAKFVRKETNYTIGKVASNTIKKSIVIIGIVLLLIVFTLNIICTANISDDKIENVTIQLNSILMIFVTIVIAIGLCILIKQTKNINPKLKIIIICIVVVAYFICQIGWIEIRKAKPVADQLEVYRAAVNIYRGNGGGLKKSQYLEQFPQQLTLAWIYALIFKISVESVKILQYCNAIANTFSLIAILLITKQISKEYEININKTLIIMATFLTLPMLSTFIYGDFISLPMCLFSIYFIMKYGEKNKIRYAIISALLISIAYIARMNNLIYIIALLIYLLLDILKAERKIQKIAIIIMFVIIAIFPTSIIKSAIQNKLEFDKKNKFPVAGFLCMGMAEGPRTNGWYNSNIANIAKNDIDNSKQICAEAIPQRIKYLITNPLYTIKFYAVKTASMWAENTYSAIWYNQSFNFNIKYKTEIEKEWLDVKLKNIRNDIVVYQKALILIIFGSTIQILLKYKDKLSNEVILLITIFIGGFLFHVLWEAKSRYIISYIVVLIPVASIIIHKGEENEKIRLFNCRRRAIWSNICKRSKKEK